MRPSPVFFVFFRHREALFSKKASGRACTRFSAHGVLGVVFPRSSFSSPLRTRVRGFKFGWPGEERHRHAPLPGLFSIFSRDWRASWEPASVRTAFFRKEPYGFFRAVSNGKRRAWRRGGLTRVHARTCARPPPGAHRYLTVPPSWRFSPGNKPHLGIFTLRAVGLYPALCGRLPCVL